VTIDPAQIIQVSKAPHFRSTNWGNHELALSALLEWVSKLRVGDKSNGEVWAPATLEGFRRIATEVQGTHLAVFDSDAGHTLAQLKAAFQTTGWAAFIIPSSSWGKTETEGSADHYDAWRMEQPDTSAPELPERYLVEVLHKTKEVAKGAIVLNRLSIPIEPKRGKKGKGKQSEKFRHLIRFQHQPCEKYRIICVLAERFDLSTKEARRRWKKHYDAMIDVVGLPLDHSTGSPERLFYLSYMSPDRIAPARLHQAVVEGGPIDISRLPEPAPRERTRRGGFRTFAEDRMEGRGSDDEPLDYIWEDIDLRVSTAKGLLQHLELADVLQENGWPQDDRGCRDGKYHIECPFTHEHTEQHDGGTYVWNASDYGQVGMTELAPGAGIKCQHNSCDHRDRLEFIQEFLNKGGLKRENLLGALNAARDKSLEQDFDVIDPDLVVLKPLVKPTMAWTRDQVISQASALRRLKRENSTRFDELAAGWDALGTIELDELELLVDLADDETDEPPPPKGGNQRWRDKLQYSKDGTPVASATNISLCLEHGLGLGGGGVAYNILKDRLDIRDPASLPWAKPDEDPRPWRDNDDTEAAMHVERLLGGLVIRPHTVTPIIESLGRRHAYHPVRDYLNGLVWDGIPRLDRLLIDYGGADDNPFVRAATARTLIAAVARAMKPGCKVDTALILESTQGFKKSTLFSALAVHSDYFSDSTGHIGEKTAAEMACTHWIIEMAELVGLTKGDLNQIKAFLSRQYDKFRPAYGRRVVDYPRQCIMVGTVNRETNGYLKDLTGNRRFWIIKVGKIAWDYINDWRDQIWAEAKARYDAGEKWWFDDDTEQHLIEAQQETAKERTAEPELVGDLRRFISHKPGVSGHDRDFSDGWPQRAAPLTVIPNSTHYWNAIGKPTRDISFTNKVAFNQACQALGWEVHQEVRKTNPIGLERGARYYISPEGVEAHKDGRLHEWLDAQARLGAVAGLPNPLEGLADVIILEDRKKPKPKKDDGLDPAKPV
jgi:hypothetical protein